MASKLRKSLLLPKRGPIRARSRRFVANLPPGYGPFLEELKARIQAARVKAALSVNRELIALYWYVGKSIVERQRAAGWGKAIVERLAADLQKAFPGMEGFSPRNVWRMRAFYQAWTEEVKKLPRSVAEADGQNLPQPVAELDRIKLPQVVAEIPWGHNMLLLEKTDEPIERLWYASKTVENGWSRDILSLQIETDLYGRQGKATTNFKLALPKPQSALAQQTLKDPYIFYHTKLRCYVVIELKGAAFKPEYSGQINFYLSAVDDIVKAPNDNPSIGILLCATKDKVLAEYALRDVKKPIGVAAWQTKLTTLLPKKLKGTLPTIEELEKELTLPKISGRSF